jgi:hypothetical protein
MSNEYLLISNHQAVLEGRGFKPIFLVNTLSQFALSNYSRLQSRE